MTTEQSFYWAMAGSLCAPAPIKTGEFIRSAPTPSAAFTPEQAYAIVSNSMRDRHPNTCEPLDEE